MKTVNPQSALAAIAVASLCACSGVLDPPGEGQQPGVISFYNDPVVVEAPETVVRGQTFTVSVRTYGGGCITQGPTGVRVDDLLATVTPMDINSGANVCTAELRMFRHEASIRFDRAGTATVVLRGTRLPEDEPVTVLRTITVL